MAAPARDGAAVATERAPTPPEPAPAPGGEPVVDADAPRRLDAVARDRLLADIRAARIRRLTAAARTTGPDRGGAGGGSDGADQATDEEAKREVIREAMQDLIPLVTDCYNEALAASPALQGEITVEFVIDAEPDVGGLVSGSRVVEADPEIDHPGLRECVQETMYALEIEPPEHAAHDTFRYPFLFAPE
jgi:hypothetical protein